MGFRDALTKFRQWDNKAAKWLMYNFYYTFFHLIVVIAFMIWVINMISAFLLNLRLPPLDITQKLLLIQANNTTILTFLALLNSLWILYLLNNSHRIKNSLKNISYNTAPRPFNRDKRRNEPRDKNEPKESQS